MIKKYTIGIAIGILFLIGTATTVHAMGNTSPQTGSVLLTTPNGGQTYTAGQKIDVSWVSHGLPDTATVLIYLSKDDGVTPSALVGVKGYLMNKGHEIITIPANTLAGNYTMGVYAIDSTLTGEIADHSDTDFTIVAPTAFVTLTSPNGGEIYATGQKVTVTWKSSGVDTVYLSLLMGAKDLSLGSESGISAADGSYVWTVPDMSGYADLFPNNGYKILIYNNSATNDIRDTTDGTFTILPAGSTIPAVTFPSGCTSASGFSTTTGHACGAIVTTCTDFCPPPTNYTKACRMSARATLRVGQRSDDVKTLQQVLIDSGYLSGNADGSFGMKTKAAVMMYQKANKLFPDGVVGAMMRSKLMEGCTYDAMSAPSSSVSSNTITKTNWGISYTKSSEWNVLKDTDAQTLLTQATGEWVGDQMSIDYVSGPTITDTDAKFGSITYSYDDAKQSWVETDNEEGENVSPHPTPVQAVSVLTTADGMPVFKGTGRWETLIVPLSHTTFLKLSIGGSGNMQPLEDLVKTIKKI